MGFVVAAWHLELEQSVAVKLLHSFALSDGESAERFRREARAAAKIHGEHVARVLDVGVLDSGVPYMVMEYLEGHDLSDEMAKICQFTSEDATDIALQAIEALAEAHAAGIVHRDLKPANLFLATRPDGTRIVKVLDFGISKSLGEGNAAELSLTRSAMLIGSPLYMSPEQMRSSKDVDTRTDIWSLGVILYEMITGQAPYKGESIGELCAALLTEEAAPMHTLCAGVSPDLEAVVMRCLAKDREQRFATVSELARALLPFASPSSQVHVDRASRMLNAPGAWSESKQVRSGASSALGSPEPPARALPPPATIGSWGRADPPESSQPVQPRKTRRVLFVGVGACLTSLLCTTLFLVHGQAPRAAQSAAPSAVAPLPAALPMESAASPSLALAASSAQPAASAFSRKTQPPVKTPTKPRWSAAARQALVAETSAFGGRR